MLKSLFTIFILIFLSSCITINQYENSKPVVDKKTNNSNFNKPKSPKLSYKDKKQLEEITIKAADTLAKCLVKLVNVGVMTRNDAHDFKDKLAYGLKIENTLLFSTMTENEQFCYKWVPIFHKKDSYILDEELNKFWKRRNIKNKY